MKKYLRGGVYAALFLAAAAFAGCAGAGNSVLTPAPKPTPTPTPKPVVAYTAIGASDAVGYGATKPCTTATPALGAADPTCLGITGTGYVPVLARSLEAAGSTVTLDDLGYSGAVTGPDILATVNSYGFAGTPTQCPPGRIITRPISSRRKFPRFRQTPRSSRSSPAVTIRSAS